MLIFHFLDKMLRNLSKQMVTRVAAINAMITVAIQTLGEILVGLHQSFCIIIGVHGMNIVIGCSMTNQQIAV